MKKVLLIINLFACLLLVLTGCSSPNFENDTGKNGIMIINGKTVKSDYIMLYKADDREYSHIPLTEVLLGLSVNFGWLGDDQGDILYDGKRYILDLKEKSLVREGDNFNILVPAPGETRFYCNITEREVVLNDDAVRVILNFIGKKVEISIDYENSVVHISDMAL